MSPLAWALNILLICSPVLGIGLLAWRARHAHAGDHPREPDAEP